MAFSAKFGDGFLLNYFIKTNPFGLAPVEDCEAAGGLRPPSPTVYISLHTGLPTYDYAVALSNELSGLNYARGQLAPDPTTAPIRWSNPYNNGSTGQREANNIINIVFPTAIGGNWQPVGGMAFWRVASGGAARDYIAHTGGDPLFTVTNGNKVTLLANTGIRLIWVNTIG